MFCSFRLGRNAADGVVFVQGWTCLQWPRHEKEHERSCCNGLQQGPNHQGIPGYHAFPSCSMSLSAGSEETTPKTSRPHPRKRHFLRFGPTTMTTSRSALEHGACSGETYSLARPKTTCPKRQIDWWGAFVAPHSRRKSSCRAGSACFFPRSSCRSGDLESADP